MPKGRPSDAGRVVTITKNPHRRVDPKHCDICVVYWTTYRVSPPLSGSVRSWQTTMRGQAPITSVAANLALGESGSALDALEALIRITPDQRLDTLVRRLAQVRKLMADPR